MTQLGRITQAELAQHKTRDDCWHAYGGKVYNVTPFLKYHPGGVGEMMRAAGKDGEFGFASALACQLINEARRPQGLSCSVRLTLFALLAHR